MSQIAFSLSHTPRYQREDFLVSDANREALAWMERDLPFYGVMLYGPPSSGKTHLAHIWAARTGAVFLDNITAPPPPYAVVEGVENIKDETALFHFLNQAKETNAKILFTAGVAPHDLPFRLPDLLSRVKGLPWITLQAPDDALLSALMVKLFSDRQLKVGQEVIDYVLPRIERTPAAVHQLVAKLDDEALKQKKSITLPFIRTHLS